MSVYIYIYIYVYIYVYIYLCVCVYKYIYRSGYNRDSAHSSLFSLPRLASPRLASTRLECSPRLISPFTSFNTSARTSSLLQLLSASRCIIRAN